MNKMWRALAIATVLLFTGCRTTAMPPPVETVPVIVEKIVGVPPELTEPCHIERRQQNSYGELKRLRGVDIASLRECSSRMEKIRKLGEP